MEQRELTEIVNDLTLVMHNLRNDLERVNIRTSGWKADAKRARARTVTLSKLGLEFRKASLHAERSE